MSGKRRIENEFSEDDDDKNKKGGAGYVPKQSLDPKIFLNDASKDVVPGIVDDNYCVNCFEALKKCKCGKTQPGPKGGSSGKDQQGQQSKSPGPTSKDTKGSKPGK